MSSDQRIIMLRKPTKSHQGYQPFCEELLSFLRVTSSSSSSMEWGPLADLIISIKLWFFWLSVLWHSRTLTVSKLEISQNVASRRERREKWGKWLTAKRRKGWHCYDGWKRIVMADPKAIALPLMLPLFIKTVETFKNQLIKCSKRNPSNILLW